MVAVASALPHNTASLSQKSLSDPRFGPIPGQTDYYSAYKGKSAPFPATYSEPVFPTAKGPPGPDDVLFQNLLAAEWAIYAFYQYGVNKFSSAAFEKAGFPSQTYDRIIELRDNEAGHARIFQNAISATSIKPALCKYEFSVITDPKAYLAAHTVIEVGSMAFLTGLILQAKLEKSKQTLLAIAETESRHEAWGLIDLWHQSPFAGPVDTIFPYANQILDTTQLFVTPGSCPKANPKYPYPSQNLPAMGFLGKYTSLLPGKELTIVFTDPKNQPHFKHGQTYYAVFYHGIYSKTQPFDTKTHKTKIPKDFEAKGLFLVVISDTPGAPSKENVKAGPLLIVEQPLELNTGVSG